MRTDPDEYATFELASQLHMTVAELRRRMSSAEFTRWMVFFREKNRRERKHQPRARR